MGGTDVLREDHQTIRAALSEAGDAFAVGIGQVAAMRECYGELSHAIARHLKTEEEVLAPQDVMETHHREQDQLQAVQAKLEHLSQDAEAAWSALIGLVEGVRQDMWSEELDLFPTVERVESVPPEPRSEVRQALAEHGSVLRRPAASGKPPGGCPAFSGIARSGPNQRVGEVTHAEATMHIQEIMTRDPEACLATDSCAAAVGIMRRRNCGFVPVVDSQATRRVIGVVTDRDVALYFERVNRPAGEIPVSGCMTKDVKTIGPSATLSEAAKVMEQYAIHRLPVLEDGRLVGVLSLKDIAVAADKRGAYPESTTAEQKLGEIVEAIASAR